MYILAKITDHEVFSIGETTFIYTFTYVIETCLLFSIKYVESEIKKTKTKTKQNDCLSSLSKSAGSELTTLVVIGTDCISGGKSSYHTITTTTAPLFFNIVNLCIISVRRNETDSDLHCFV